jgi:hypothetical protein
MKHAETQVLIKIRQEGRGTARNISNFHLVTQTDLGILTVYYFVLAR